MMAHNVPRIQSGYGTWRLKSGPHGSLEPESLGRGFMQSNIRRMSSMWNLESSDLAFWEARLGPMSYLWISATIVDSAMLHEVAGKWRLGRQRGAVWS